MEWTADFETTTDPEDCRVWAWGATPIGRPDDIHEGNTLDGFMEFVERNAGTYWFHNLAFDGEFILCWLLDHGFRHVKKGGGAKTFTTLISGTGKWYQMKVKFSAGRKKPQVTFKDSLKKLPMGVDAVARAFKLPISKLELDYKAYREPGHVLTPEESEYLAHDVQIMNMALSHQFEQGLTRLTIGSDALNWYKDIVGRKWKRLFPVLPLEMDADIRRAYKGGFTYVNPRFQSVGSFSDLTFGAGSVYDVNSLYPSVMYDRPLPCGVPVRFAGEYVPDERYPLYIQFFTASIHVKPDHLPTVQIKNSPWYSEREYITDTDGTADFAMTSVDLKLLFDHYDVDVVSWDGGYKFHERCGLFCEYIDYWMKIKSTTTGGLRQLAKLMLNSLYGKFATNPDVTPKIPHMNPDGSISYKLGDEETRDPVYTALGAFVTAWARDKTIRSAQAVYERFMYADTDSLHVLGTDPVDGIEVHPTKLGAWKHESDFSKCKYIRAKTYMERICATGEVVDGEYRMVPCEEHDDVKCAGMPKNVKRMVTFENFKPGLSLAGKLVPMHVPGGIVLRDTTFTVK